jgi:hypothetical protein
MVESEAGVDRVDLLLAGTRAGDAGLPGSA